MSPVQAAFLALIQAVTEFLPISSSGHLILVPYFLSWKDQGLEFDIATNTGTLLAILLYFRRDLWAITRGTLGSLSSRGQEEPLARNLFFALLVGTVPAGLVGLVIEDWVATEARSPLLVGFNAIAYGLLLGVADRFGSKRKGIEQLHWKHGLLIGAAQALALVPGTSRSGITMTAALALGFDRGACARFSFLLAVPIGLALALKQVVALASGSLAGLSWTIFGVAVGASALGGYVVIAGLLAWLRQRSLVVFVVYRLLLGSVLLASFG